MPESAPGLISARFAGAGVPIEERGRTKTTNLINLKPKSKTYWVLVIRGLNLSYHNIGICSKSIIMFLFLW